MVLVILFFVLSFMAIFGTYLNINPYDSYIWIKAISHFVFLIFTMMIIPFCYKRFRKTENNKKGRKLCLLNVFIILTLYFIIDIFIMGGIFDETFQNLGANIIYALMFYYINRKLFFSKNKAKEIDNETTTEIDYNDEDEITPTANISQEETSIKKRYCSVCGNLIDNTSKKCGGCGKQYFKGIQWKKLLPFVTLIFLVLSIIINIILLVDNSNAKNDIEKLKQDVNTPSFSEYIYDQLKQKSDFVDKFVVFVEDDTSNLYHKYECDQFVGDYFWCYNIDAAKEQGYYPCPKCHN